MHVIEHLRSRRTDAQKLLLSRKRKLAELYSVTTYSGDLVDPSANQVYFQQLQAFQDANDLEKGRIFEESTLPPRPQIQRLTRSAAAQAAKHNALQPPRDVRRSKSPFKAEKSLSPKGTESPRSRIASPRPPTRSHKDIKQSSDDVKQRDTSESDGLRSGNDTVDGESTNGLVPTDSSKPGRSPSKTTTSPVDDNKDQQRLQVEAKSSGRSASRKQSPAILTAPTAAEPQSSPASTNGPPSSNTPAPEGGSPNTSPEDEVALVQIENEGGTKHDQSKQQAPHTPDLHVAQPHHKVSISSLDVDMTETDPSAAFESPIQSVKPDIPTPKDTASKRPSIRVDTQQDIRSYMDSGFSQGIVETPHPMTSGGTPKQTPATTPGAESARRATRIQSGALQKKSVSEILGETTKLTSAHADSPSSVSGKTADKDRKEKDRSKLSTVVFAKPQRANAESDTVEIIKAEDRPHDSVATKERDYMYTLFEGRAYSQNRQGTLPYLLQHSHKTLSTTDHLVDYQYQAHYRVLKRLHQLQNLDRWSLRQRKRADEPPRPTSHWDFLIDHMKWMRTDFREERRWKLAAARATAEACAEWVTASPEERKLLQVKVRPPRILSSLETDADVEMGDGPGPSISSPPELEPTGEDDSVSESIADPRDLSISTAPAAIFSLGASDFTFTADRTPAFDKLLNELPLYEPAPLEPDLSRSNLAEKLDSRWKTDIVPVSRYAMEKLKVKEHKPPLKRSRYDYDVEDSPPRKRAALPPREKDVALFMTENKHIRDRIHPGHSFRPPAEHPMPTQAFFETRTSSQWVANDDDEVRKQAREFSFNWLLISDLLTPPTLYVSGQDRRTPWECFERWIGLEGMPADMSKTPYFKTYSGRIEAAGRNVLAQWEEQQRRNAGTNAPNLRKRTTQPVRVERKKAQRHLFMLDAMRRLAKKRETVRQKALHSADMAAMRKSNDVHAPRPGMKTPAEWSQHKFDREQKIAKQQEMYKQQLIAHQRAVVQQQRGQGGPANGMPVPSQVGGPVRGPGVPGGSMPGMPNGHLQVPNSQQRPNPNMLGVPQGMGMPAGMVGPKGMQQGQMQGMPRPMAGSPEQIKMHQEQMLRQAQSAQQNGSHSSPHAQHAAMANGQGMNNAAYMAAMAQQRNGQPSPTTAVGSSTSPRPGSSHMGQSLSSGSVPKINQLYANLKESHPNLSDEEVQKIATQQLFQWQQQATAAAAGQTGRPKVANQAALNAAMGAQNSAFAAQMASSGQQIPNAGQGMMSYEQVQAYNQRVRMQQAQQQAQQHGVARGMQVPMPPGMPTGMSNSPVMNMARPVSQHSQQGGMSRSATPRDQRSGSVSNMNNGQVNGQGPQSSPRSAQAPMQT